MSWMRPQFDPDYYILFYPCRLKCDLSNVILKTVNVTGKLYSYTISPLKASSNCILTLTAEYGGTFSNTLSSFINTTLAGKTQQLYLMYELHVSPSSPYWCSWRTH